MQGQIQILRKGVDMGPVLHDGIVKLTLFPVRKGLHPIGLIQSAVNPAAVILALKNENPFFVDQDKINFGGFAHVGYIDIFQNGKFSIVPFQFPFYEIFSQFPQPRRGIRTPAGSFAAPFPRKKKTEKNTGRNQNNRRQGFQNKNLLCSFSFRSPLLLRRGDRGEVQEILA